jgi:hypothetical protein
MAEQEAIAAYIAAHRMFTPYIREQFMPRMSVASLQTSSHLPTAEELADEFLEDADFRALQLGTWLGTPDGASIADAVALVIPPQYRTVFNLAVDGLKLAADAQTRDERKDAAKFAGTVLACAIGLVLLLQDA